MYECYQTAPGRMVPATAANCAVTPCLPVGNETILLVEPEPEVLLPAARTLRRLGYRVIEASGGAEAYRQAAGNCGDIQLVVTEAAMSGLNGHELVRQLRGRNPGLRVVFVAEADYERLTRRVALRKGLTFVQRPFTAHTLATKVRQVLDAPPPGQSDAA